MCIVINDTCFIATPTYSYARANLIKNCLKEKRQVGRAVTVGINMWPFLDFFIQKKVFSKKKTLRVEWGPSGHP